MDRLIITPGTRQKPSELHCSCDAEALPSLTVHHDFIECTCNKCGETYALPMMSNVVWNCCSEPENGCGAGCKNKIHTKPEAIQPIEWAPPKEAKEPIHDEFLTYETYSCPECFTTCCEHTDGVVTKKYKCCAACGQPLKWPK